MATRGGESNCITARAKVYKITNGQASLVGTLKPGKSTITVLGNGGRRTNLNVTREHRIGGRQHRAQQQRRGRAEAEAPPAQQPYRPRDTRHC